MREVTFHTHFLEMLAKSEQKDFLQLRQSTKRAQEALPLQVRGAMREVTLHKHFLEILAKSEQKDFDDLRADTRFEQ